VLHKCLKTGSKSGIPSKICLLKDLVEDIFRGRQVFFRGDAPAREFELSKSLKSHCCYQTANGAVNMLAAWERARQGKSGGVEGDLKVKPRGRVPGLENRETWGTRRNGHVEIRS
jgi:hypothetical protein